MHQLVQNKLSGRFHLQFNLIEIDIVICSINGWRFLINKIKRG